MKLLKEENLEVLSVDLFPFGSENYLLLTEINLIEKNIIDL